MKRVRVSVPATTSNLGPGFDVLGMALTLRMTLTLTAEGGQRPLDRSNMVVRSFLAGLGRHPVPRGLAFDVRSDIPRSRGLGSSAAARLCGLLAAEALKGLTDEGFADAVAKACALEGHPDNAVPAAYGGLRSTLMAGAAPLHVEWPTPKDLGVAVCVPDYEVETERARAVLPAKVPLADAAANAARTVHLLGALRTGRLTELGPAMRDSLHQPYRRRLLPGFDAALKAAAQAGAFGAALSGSGSAVLAFTPRGGVQARVAAAMVRAFGRAGKPARALTPDIDRTGAKVGR